MGKKPIVAGAVLVALIAVVVAGITAVRPTAPTITVLNVKSVQSNDLTAISFEPTNHTTGNWLISGLAVQFGKEGAWSRFIDLRPTKLLGPHEIASVSFEVSNSPAVYPIRLKLYAHRRQDGLEGLLRRLKLRIFERQRSVSLNPFDKRNLVFGGGSERTEGYRHIYRAVKETNSEGGKQMVIKPIRQDRPFFFKTHGGRERGIRRAADESVEPRELGQVKRRRVKNTLHSGGNALR